MQNQKGFTLLELLVVIAIIGILSYLGISNYNLYTTRAAYISAQSGLVNARTDVEASLANPDVSYSAVSYSQKAPGALTDTNAKRFLPTVKLSRNMKATIYHDPTCVTSACTAQTLQFNHCAGKEYVRWVQYGDGFSTMLTHLAGSGCP